MFKRIILLWKNEDLINEKFLFLRYLDGSECKPKKAANEGCSNGIECISKFCFLGKCSSWALWTVVNELSFILILIFFCYSATNFALFIRQQSKKTKTFNFTIQASPAKLNYYKNNFKRLTAT